ncbi:conjugal transfer protein TrbE [Henriciella litoralis]|jgi:type IV secretion system protein VirB4|uniref:conjugal transfer protein TrbE n=1 Tax=Henriciella litoralis TaxID=568102 RepID=UPI0009FFE14F|nr:conjugal transfer protein TrbE [Henriciella litoralis]|tara:strand:- start:7836 stop:10283 length:2448 start_codon:yes stop_codon:yes gene_type:complete
MLNLSEYAAKPAHLSDYLPWACLVAPGVVLNKDGAFQTSFRYRGPDLESSTEAELVAVTARVNNVLRRFGSGWALFFEAVRQEAESLPESAFGDAAAWLIEQERRASGEETGARYESTYYLTLLWLPPADATGRAEKALIERPEKRDGEDWRQRLEQFRTRAAQTLDLLSTALDEIHPLSDAETLTYLHACISSKRHPVAVPDLPVFLDAVLADESFDGGLEPRIGNVHLATLTLLGFPTSTLPGMLDELNRLGFSYRWTTRYIAMDKAEAEKLLARKRRHWFAKRKSVGAVLRETLFNEQAALLDNDADNKAADADAALQELGSDLVSYGYVTTTLTLMGETREEVEARNRAVERVINGRGFTTIRETLNAVEAWLGSLPGHVYANVRQPILHTLNLAHLTPISSVWAGDQWNSHLGDRALIEAQTEVTTPFRLNLHVGDVGHTLIIGPTGSGKSVLLSLLAAQWQRYEDAQAFIFDKGRSVRAVTLAMGGTWLPLAGDERPALQPLKDIDTERGASFAADWLLGLIEAEGVTVTPDLKSVLWDAVQSLASAPVAERTLTGLSLILQSDTLKAALHPYTLEGAHGHLLDSDAEDLDLSSVACFEMDELMQTPSAVAPVITYLFHRLEDRFDGKPTLLILDEAWLFLDHPVFAARLRDWLKTLRKKNVAVMFATQSLADIEGASIAPALIESCPTRIFLPNERALEPGSQSVYRRFGLNDRQIDIIAKSVPKRDYYYTSPLGCRLFELGLGEVALAFCGAASPADQKQMDGLLEAGAGAGFAQGWLELKQLGWAADLLGDWPDAAGRSPAQMAAE